MVKNDCRGFGLDKIWPIAGPLGDFSMLVFRPFPGDEGGTAVLPNAVRHGTCFS